MLNAKQGLLISFVIIVILSSYIIHEQSQDYKSEIKTLMLENSKLSSLNEELSNKQTEKQTTHKPEVLLCEQENRNDTKTADEFTNKKANEAEISVRTAQRLFSEQTIDYDWALPVESTVIDTFINDDSINEFGLERVECRRSTCEFTITNAYKDTLHQSALIIMALEKSGLVRESFQYSERLENGQFKLYLSLKRK